MAGQIVLDLKGKFQVMPTEMIFSSPQYDEAVEVLIALGYKPQEVDKVMNTLVHENLDTNGYVKKALSLLVKV